MDGSRPLHQISWNYADLRQIPSYPHLSNAKASKQKERRSSLSLHGAMRVVWLGCGLKPSQQVKQPLSAGSHCESRQTSASNIFRGENPFAARCGFLPASCAACIRACQQLGHCEPSGGSSLVFVFTAALPCLGDGIGPQAFLAQEAGSLTRSVWNDIFRLRSLSGWPDPADAQVAIGRVCVCISSCRLGGRPGPGLQMKRRDTLLLVCLQIAKGRGNSYAGFNPFWSQRPGWKCDHY